MNYGTNSYIKTIIHVIHTPINNSVLYIFVLKELLFHKNCLIFNHLTLKIMIHCTLKTFIGYKTICLKLLNSKNQVKYGLIKFSSGIIQTYITERVVQAQAKHNGKPYSNTYKTHRKELFKYF